MVLLFPFENRGQRKKAGKEKQMVHILTKKLKATQQEQQKEKPLAYLGHILLQNNSNLDDHVPHQLVERPDHFLIVRFHIYMRQIQASRKPQCFQNSNCLSMEDPRTCYHSCQCFWNPGY